MSNAILERGVKPFDVLKKGTYKYVVKESVPARDIWVLIRDDYAQKLDYGTQTWFSFEALVEEFKFGWEVDDES